MCVCLHRAVSHRVLRVCVCVCVFVCKQYRQRERERERERDGWLAGIISRFKRERQREER